MQDVRQPPLMLPSIEGAYFRVAQIDLYPHTRTQPKAERVIACVQALLPSPLKVLSYALYMEADIKPLFRVKAELQLDSIGAYQTLSYLLEFFRPVALSWQVVIPTHSPGATWWDLWGRADRPSVIGLHSLFFGSESEDPPKENGAA